MGIGREGFWRFKNFRCLIISFVGLVAWLHEWCYVYDMRGKLAAIGTVVVGGEKGMKIGKRGGWALMMPLLSSSFFLFPLVFIYVNCKSLVRGEGVKEGEGARDAYN